MQQITSQNSPIGKFMSLKEKVFLPLAKITPSFITPNLITVVRALFIIPIYFAYQQGAYTFITILFIIALISDVFDGVQARYHKKVSTIGKLIDPAADKILFIGLFLLIAPDRLSQAIIYTIIILEACLVLLAVLVAPLMAYFFKIKGKLGANNAGKIKMTLEGLAILILLFGLNNSILIGMSEIILWLAAFFALMSIIIHLKTKDLEPRTRNQEQRT